MTDTATTPSEAPNVPVASESVQIPVPAQTPAPVPETKAESAPAPEASKEGDQAQDAKKSSAIERIARLTAERRMAEARAAAAETDARQLRKQLTEQLHPENIERLPYEQQLQAQTQRAIKTERFEEKVSEVQRATEDALRATLDTFNAKADEARSRIPDFDQVVQNPNVKITREMAEIIAEFDKAPEVAYYLGKNPHEAAQIAALAPHLQGSRLAQIEAKVSVAPRKFSNAPAPVPQVSAAVAGSVAKDPASMTMSEFADWAHKAGLKGVLS